MRKANLTRAYGCAQQLCCGTCSRLSGVASRYLEAPASVAVGDYINWDRNSKMWFRVAAIDWHRRMVKVQESTEVRALGAGPLRLRFVGDDDADHDGDADEPLKNYPNVVLSPHIAVAHRSHTAQHSATPLRRAQAHAAETSQMPVYMLCCASRCGSPCPRRRAGSAPRQSVCRLHRP